MQSQVLFEEPPLAGSKVCRVDAEVAVVGQAHGVRVVTAPASATSPQVHPLQALRDVAHHRHRPRVFFRRGVTEVLQHKGSDGLHSIFDKLLFLGELCKVDKAGHCVLVTICRRAHGAKHRVGHVPTRHVCALHGPAEARRLHLARADLRRLEVGVGIHAASTACRRVRKALAVALPCNGQSLERLDVLLHACTEHGIPLALGDRGPWGGVNGDAAYALEAREQV
mmetsp:Transcript_6715/g.20913  ORF Transcript_6715/g.20913 Transcript_6715/m.20913 type:complete len:225 (-) Transcript_6715:32-706(-)